MLDDVRIAVRGLARAKGLAGVLLVSLALGTGANVAVFGTAYTLLFSAPAGVGRGGSLVDVYTSRFDGATYGPSSYADFTTLIATGLFDTIAAADDHAVMDLALGSTQQTRIAAVSSDFFAVLNMRARQGRMLTVEDAATPLRGAVISSHAWETSGRDDQIVGRRIRVGATEHVVVGVAPDRFRGLQAGRPTDVWVPLEPGIGENARGNRRLAMIGRLRPGTGLEEVRSRLLAVSADLARRYPATNLGTIRNPDEPRAITALEYSRLDPAARRQAALIAAVIGGAVVLLLASACVNAGSLLHSRALARRREIAVKMALGATRGLLVRRLLVETVTVSIAGAALGLLFAVWTLRIIPSLFAPEHAAMLDTRLNVGLVLATIAAAAIAGILFGLGPAVRGTAETPALALRSDSGEISDGRSGSPARGVLVIVQLAVSVVLLVGAGLLASSLATALEGDLGFTARRIALFAVKTAATADNQERTSRALLDVEGIRDVAWASAPPLTRGAARQFRVPAGSATGVADAIEANVNVVSPRYFHAIRLPLIEGRYFNAEDHGRAKAVVMVDEALARRYLGGVAAGRILLDTDGASLEVVGVVRSGRYRALQEPPPPTVYYPTSQEYLARGYVVIRTESDPQSMLKPLADTLRGAGLAVERTSTLDARLAETLALDRLVTTLVGVCGLMALIMATLGVYGVMSDAVRRRTREIGLRVALGAGRPQVIRLVLSEALYLTGAGLAAGIGAALLAARVAGTFVHGLPAVDPLTLSATPGMLAIVVGAASMLPLRRALRVSPTIALRSD